jgi:hypothetical protein
MAIAARINTATSGFAITKPTSTCAKAAIAAMIWSGLSGRVVEALLLNVFHALRLSMSPGGDQLLLACW